MRTLFAFVAFVVGSCVASYQQSGYGKSCYQCAYSPPKTYYDKKLVVQQSYAHQQQGYDQQPQGYGQQQGYQQTYVPVKRTVMGGWGKCMGELDHYTAKHDGVDVWDCHSNCFVRKDRHGNINRGCYKGEFNVDPYRLGCSHQAGAFWCFCEGDKCNTLDIEKQQQNQY